MIGKKTRALIELKKRYDALQRGKESLLEKIDEVELAEQVYNSNAIENSTLTLEETEKILLEQSVRREISIRELYEAKNLSNVVTYLSSRKIQNVDLDLILLLHRFLIGGINDSIAGRLRKGGEYVRIADHIAPSPDDVEKLVQEALRKYNEDTESTFVERIALFHLEFERIHPFVDGNGRIGRVLINQHLANLGFPPVIIRNKSKRDAYYPVFKNYQHTKDAKDILLMVELLQLSLSESLYKRLAYLEGKKIVNLTDYARSNGTEPSSILAKARRQTIEAFREKGVWKIGV